MNYFRSNKILEIINSRDVSTQEELRGILHNEGFDVTQATLSRDMRELNIKKVTTKDGIIKYIVPDTENIDFPSIVAQSIIKTDYSGNIVVIKCHAGTAQAVCASLDKTEWTDSVGTIAGDDTIFMLMRNEKSAAELSEKFARLL